MVREPDFVDECYKNKDLSLLKKLTLVIPTYNRNYYLSRCLWYHAHFPFGQIIVADSSPEEKKVVNRETVAKIREMFNSNVLYLEYQPETEKYGRDIYRKWGDAVQHVETEYSEICTDKEFVIPTTISRGIEFLDANNDYGSVDGKYRIILRGGKKEGLLFINVYDNAHGWDTKCSLPYNSPLERYLVATSRVYASTNIMAIRRSKNHKEIYNNLDKYNLFDLRFGEFIVEFETTIQSKHKYFDDAMFNCRDLTHDMKIGVMDINESSCARYPALDNYISDGMYNSLFESGVNLLRDEIIKYGCDTASAEIEDILRTTIPHAIERRGLYGNKSQYNIYLSKIIGERLTEIIISTASQTIRKLNSRQSSLISLPPELKIITRLINNSNDKYSLDLPIIGTIPAL